jgi:hypothetical protein
MCNNPHAVKRLVGGQVVVCEGTLKGSEGGLVQMTVFLGHPTTKLKMT